MILHKSWASDRREFIIVTRSVSEEFHGLGFVLARASGYFAPAARLEHHHRNQDSTKTDAAGQLPGILFAANHGFGCVNFAPFSFSRSA